MPYLGTNYELPFQSQSPTSHDAAVAAAEFIGLQGERVFEWFERQAGGATQREASEALGIGRPSMCARVRALELAGRLVKCSGRRQGCAIYRTVRSAS